MTSSGRRSCTGSSTSQPVVCLAIGYGISTLGNFLNLLAINFYVYQLTGSALLTGLLMAARLTAAFLCGVVAGRLVARFRHRTVMIWCDVGQTAAMLALLVVPAALHPHLLWAVAIVLGAGNTLFMVALRTCVPNLTGPAGRVRGNGYLVTAKALGTVLGFAAAGPLIQSVGFHAAFAVNAGSFLVCAALLLRLPSPRRISDRPRPPSASTATARKPRHLAVLLLASPAMVLLIGLRGIEGWSSASHNVALPVLAPLVEPARPAVFLSQFWTAWAVGSLVTYRVVQWWHRRTGRHLGGRAYAASAALASVAFVLAFVDMPRPLMILAAMVAGFADGAAELVYATELQDSPDAVRARLFGASATVETLGLGSGMLAGAVLLQHLHPLTVVAAFHSVMLAAAIFCLNGCMPRGDGRRSDRRTASRAGNAPTTGAKA